MYGEDLTALTRYLTVWNFLIAADVTGDMNVRFARAAVTRRNVSSPQFRLERPGKKRETHFIILEKKVLYPTPT